MLWSNRFRVFALKLAKKHTPAFHWSIKRAKFFILFVCFSSGLFNLQTRLIEQNSTHSLFLINFLVSVCMSEEQTFNFQSIFLILSPTENPFPAFDFTTLLSWVCINSSLTQLGINFVKLMTWKTRRRSETLEHVSRFVEQFSSFNCWTFGLTRSHCWQLDCGQSALCHSAGLVTRCQLHRRL